MINNTNTNDIYYPSKEVLEYSLVKDRSEWDKLANENYAQFWENLLMSFIGSHIGTRY